MRHDSVNLFSIVGESDAGSPPSALAGPVDASASVSSLRIAVGVKARRSQLLRRWNSSGIGGFGTTSPVAGSQYWLMLWCVNSRTPSLLGIGTAGSVSPGAWSRPVASRRRPVVLTKMGTTGSRSRLKAVRWRGVSPIEDAVRQG
ncbi:hypothetical protein [Streptomyces longisporus]|uniref:hypothetical protein n=1 Tax=Streptomyces longisporus TaxID=1948 RepID=UPI0031E0D032